MAQDAVLEALRSKRWISMEEIINYIKKRKREDVSKSSVYTSIQKLRKKGYVIDTKRLERCKVLYNLSR